MKNIVNSIRETIKNAVDNYTMCEQYANTLYDFLTDRESEVEDTTDTDDLYSVFEEWNNSQEIIYYYNAWNVIKTFVERENDYDLSTIRDIMNEYGFNELPGSETIATLLTQYDNNNAMSELISIIDDDDTIYTDDIECEE